MQNIHYTLAFFQFEMHGGIFHSCCSFTVIYTNTQHSENTMRLKSIKLNYTRFCSLKNISAPKPKGKNVTFLLGECMTGAGGEGGPRGIFLFILKCSYVRYIFADMSRKTKTEAIISNSKAIITWIVEVPLDLSAFPPYGWPFVWPPSWKPLPAGMVYIFKWQEQVIC